MTLTQLTYLLALDRYRHFQLAAESCGVTQPTLSMQLKKLEESLGVRLFERSRHPIEPTDIGHLVIDQARVILRESARLRELASEAGGEVTGELRVGVIPTLAPYLLPRFVSSLTSHYPGLRLVITEGITDQILDLVATDRLDAALVATPVEGPGLVDRPLFEEEFVGYLSESHALYCESVISPEQLDPSELWLLHDGHCFRDQVLSLCHEFSPRSESARPLHFESGNLAMLKRLVETSGGLTLLPALAALDLSPEDRTRVRPFHSPAPSRLVRLVQGNGYLKRGLIGAFVDALLGSLPAECAPVRGQDLLDRWQPA